MQKQEINSLSEAVIHTLAYGAVFEYPMTAQQVTDLLIGVRASRTDVEYTLGTLNGVVKNRDLYTFRHNNYIEQRIERLSISNAHLAEAYTAAVILSKIPWVQMIGISGSLSMHNSTRSDDIDFFVITSGDSLWTSRCISAGVLKILGKKRQPHTQSAPGSICTNYWIDADHLEILQKNLYTAHEIVQMKVLVNKNLMHEQFLSANAWVKEYLPNLEIERSIHPEHINAHKNSRITGRILNRWMYILQYIYMKKGMTTEQVSRGSGKFHPRDRTQSILNSYKQHVELYYQLYGKKEQTKNVYFGRLIQDMQVHANTPGS